MAEAKSASLTKIAPKKDWTKGPILKNLLLLAWPMVLMETLYVVSQIVDMIWVGKLGSAAIAGVGIANIVLMLVMTMDMGVIVGVRALISRHIGAGDIMAANQVAGQAIVLGAIWGALITAAGIFLGEPILEWFGLEEAVVAEALIYVRIMFAGWVAMDILVMCLYAIQSSGDSISPMKIEVIIRIVHVALCPFLVLGLWIFPHMGVGGAALSNVVSQVLGAFIGLWFLLAGPTRLRLARKDFRPDPSLIWRILKIGIPALIMNLQRSFGNLVLTWVIAPFGTLAVAAHSLASRVEMFIFMPGMGLGMGAGVLTGQNLGAGQPGRAEKSAWMAVGIAEAFLITCSILILFWAEKVMGVFTSDPNLIEVGSIFLRIATASYCVMAFVFVLQSCLAGAGDTLPNMIISLATIWAVALPLAFFLPEVTGLGVYGVRWAIVASTIAGVVVYIVYFRRGKWKMKKV